MIVTLAGTNAPLHACGLDANPEIICAAYARISRSPRAVHQLRAEASRDLPAARLLTERIVRHLGHQSVAEHAVFNIDLVGISRLLVEIVEHSRLASYTERSQRYVRIGEDFVVPQEAHELGLGTEFRAVVREQHSLYRAATTGRASVGGARVAKEDARYALGLATTTQVGLTANARALAAMLARLDTEPLHESRLVGRRIRRLTTRMAPSLIPPESSVDTPKGESSTGRAPPFWSTDGASSPALVWHTHEPERVVRDALTFCGLACHETGAPVLPRAFEAVQLAFMVVMSASAFAQLKRHRMATILAQPYDPGLGITIPATMEAAGILADLEAVARLSEEMSRRLQVAGGSVAAYPLLNAHRRRVLFVVNARAFKAMAALRLDRHAQWEIREHVRRMTALLWERLPELAHAMGLPNNGPTL